MCSKTFESVWDAIEDTQAAAENMKLRAQLILALQEKIEVLAWTQRQAAHCFV